MVKARAFFYVCAGLLLLALSYHLGARTAAAQSGSMVTGVLGNGTVGGSADLIVLTQNGDIYERYFPNSGGPQSLIYRGNFWSGPTPAQTESWGAVKSRYRGQSQPTPTDR